MAQHDAYATWQTLRRDARRWTLIDLHRSVIVSASQLVLDATLPVPLRALDALQLSCGLQAQRRAQNNGLSLIFLTADTRLASAAVHVGMAIDNPNNHP
jgi:hypothetical protein